MARKVPLPLSAVYTVSGPNTCCALRSRCTGLTRSPPTSSSQSFHTPACPSRISDRTPSSTERWSSSGSFHSSSKKAAASAAIATSAGKFRSNTSGSMSTWISGPFGSSA